jgi:hypothetical protein
MEKELDWIWRIVQTMGLFVAVVVVMLLIADCMGM